MPVVTPLVAQPIETLAFIPTIGGVTVPGGVKRSFGDWTGDAFLNAKNFGAVGNGVADDTAALQACFDAAYTTGGVPNGETNKYNNRPVYIPQGTYKTSAELHLTRVRGAHIIGAGSQSTQINCTAGTAVLYINGATNSRFESFGVSGGNVVTTGIRLDWDGSTAQGFTAPGLSSNVFLDSGASTCANGIKIGESGFEGKNNLFIQVAINNCTNGLVTAGAQAIGNSVILGGASVCSVGFWQQLGSISNIQNINLATNSVADLRIDGGLPCCVCGGRSESTGTGIDVISGFAVISGINWAATMAHAVNCHTGATAILDGCFADGTPPTTGPDIIGAGRVYIRGNNPTGAGNWPTNHPCFKNNNYKAAFTGTMVEDI